MRELQNEWQRHARRLPLARKVENALWTEFKSATDAVFKQRDAAISAHDGELKANLAVREALIERGALAIRLLVGCIPLLVIAGCIE